VRPSTHCHVCYSFRPHLPTEEVGYGATTCPVAPNLASLARRAPVLPRVLRPQTSPPCGGEFRCCHVSLGPGPHLLTEVSSGATMCPMAPGSASPRGELRCCHRSHGSGLCLLKRGAPVLPRVPQPPVDCGPQE
jgi:hypothetical protein